jgi:hypothetical protein
VEPPHKKQVLVGPCTPKGLRLPRNPIPRRWVNREEAEFIANSSLNGNLKILVVAHSSKG